MTDITKIVAKKRFVFHANMLDVYNVLNQLGIVSDEKAERKMAHHTVKAFEADSRLKGYATLEDYLKAMETKINEVGRP